MRNTNETTTLTVLLQDFKKHLSKRGYYDTEIYSIITSVTGADRNEILNKNNSKSKLQNKLVMFTKYSPRIKGMKK